jgi:phosphoribosyl-AMP cyclohydrolase/phosphoribosyl-ATP pyrophosphohydrolase/phosphoribosyl-AMP cyclohydrolase
MKPEITYNPQGLVPAIVQNADTKKVLMMAWMNQEAFQLTQSKGLVHFWSRSRKKLWRKGETSGNTLTLREIRIDCDGDTLLLMVDPAGPACHTGNESCFYRSIEDKDV